MRSHCGFDVAGIDTSAGQIELAGRNVGERGVVGIGSVLDIPAEDNAFDFLYIINVLHHLGSEDEQRRAFAELGIASVAAASPQAKGRVERLWGTCQDRLVSELRLAGADDLASANAVLGRFIPRFNARFAVPAAMEPAAWRSAPPARELAHICAFRWWRVVGNDNTVRVEGAVMQLPATHGGRGLTGRRVEVELHLDGRLLVVDRGRVLLVLSAPADPRRLRGVSLVDPTGPPIAAGRAERPGYPPRADHPWNRPGPKAPSRTGLTESVSR